MTAAMQRSTSSGTLILPAIGTMVRPVAAAMSWANIFPSEGLAVGLTAVLELGSGPLSSYGATRERGRNSIAGNVLVT
jgi:hypothetical protein